MSVKNHKNSLSHNTFNNFIDELLVNFGNNEEENISPVEKNEKKHTVAKHIHSKSLSRQSKEFQGEFDLESLENILFPHGRNDNAPNPEIGNLIHVNEDFNQKKNIDSSSDKEKIKKTSTKNSKKCIVF